MHEKLAVFQGLLYTIAIQWRSHYKPLELMAILVLIALFSCQASAAQENSAASHKIGEHGLDEKTTSAGLEPACYRASIGKLDASGYPTLNPNQNAYLIACALENHVAPLSLVSGGSPSDESEYNKVKTRKAIVLKQLLRRDIDADYKSESGSNLLVSLSKSNIALLDRLEIAASLLEKGVDPMVRNNNGYNAVDYAQSKKAIALVQLFKEYIAKQ
ncbi:hypothetical protein [Halioxenophilus aromaticivorans]|uniref:Ankyrin repeat domain-containing protein n=1 Tax=Halioxenophilus aromaticivorans TaxID=1306992 RepID=A0AAV3U616_9ALTE